MCSRPGCDDTPANGVRGYCPEHRNAYQREWRAGKSLPETQRIRGITRSYTNVLIRRGHLVRQPCQACGAERVQAHHPDYRDPRWVLWLCPTHHRELHASISRLLKVSRGTLTD